MASKFESTYNLIESVIGQLVSDNPGLRSGEIEKIYLAQYPEQNTLGMKIRKGVEVKTILEDKVNDVLIAFKKSGQLLNKGSRYYPLGTDLSQVSPPKKAKAKAKVKTPTLEEEVAKIEVVTHSEPVVDQSETVEEVLEVEVEPVVEEVLEVEETPVEVSEVEVEPVVEEKGVQVSTSTLVSVEEVEVEDSVAVKETTSTLTPVAEEATLEDFDLGEEVVVNDTKRITYNIKELRKGNSFDPFHSSKTLKDGRKVSKRYEVYRDKEDLNLVLTQEGREDYVVVPMDVEVEHENGAYSQHAKKALKEFMGSANHKLGSDTLIKGLVSCTVFCNHTDDFGGLVETCTNPNCPINVIWSEGAYYVDPTQ